MASPQHYQVAIVGAGFCGTMVAVHLARLAPYLSVALLEQKDTFGPGLAYSTRDPDHLLNVRAGQMGAFPDRPDHFFQWTQSHKDLFPYHRAPAADHFVSRQIYGVYLKDLLSHACQTNLQLDLLHQRIVEIRKRSDEKYELLSDNQNTITANNIVLALGNFPPNQLSSDIGFMNPYQPETWTMLAGDEDILIVGTGLTSLDLVVTLAKTKTSGHIHLLSRHGLLPRMHTSTEHHVLTLEPPYPRTALGLLRAMRQEIALAPEVVWQSVVDAFRPLHQGFWQSLPVAEQRRFLRHLRSYWDVHRHRCAPEIMDAYYKLEREGRITLHQGSILRQTAHGLNWDVVWRARGYENVETMTVKHVVRCTGPQSDIVKLDDSLVRNLLTKNLAVPDSLHMGISTKDYALSDKDGHVHEGLYTLGSLLKGTLFESIAVPELRIQAADVAARIAQKSINEL